MAARWQRLHDPDPAGWEFGGDPEQTHVFFAVYGNTAENVETRLDKLREELAQVAGAVTVTHRQDAAMLARRTEHFGFADGFGQPQIAGSGAPEYRGDGTPERRKRLGADRHGRVHPRTPERNGLPRPGAAAGGARPQRQLHGLPQDRAGRAGVPCFSARGSRAALRLRRAGKRRAARGQARRALAQRLPA